MTTQRIRQKPLYRITTQARQDIREIIRYITQHNPMAARQLVERFRQTFRLLAANPAIGHTRSDLTDGNFRFWQVKPRFLVIYQDTTQLIIIVRVMPADMDIAARLAQGAPLPP